ncbi:ankyrin-3-like isoform X2 [Leptidea sinapis]|uniref:ankyrin-3-like isoform X2 n=1 Tax=Leptidea sinapis TaxID=189913 RepID=UPI0021C2B7C5|nr:ankyrin-3-like isoform X2 [Leptidea sinapis]
MSHLEDILYSKIIIEDLEGVNPNKVTNHGKTCLGEAARLGNVIIVKNLIDAITEPEAGSESNVSKKRTVKPHKRKYRGCGHQEESVSKCKSRTERTFSESHKNEKNQGYFVLINSDGSSSDESRLRSPTCTSLESTPVDLEWDEDFSNVAPPTVEDESWCSMYMWYAAILENTGAAIEAASKFTNGINQQDAFMRTALHYAAEQGHTDVVNLLINAGSKLDVTAGDGLTPLHAAVIKNHIGTVKLLLSAGSHVNYKTHEKMTALHFAASRGYLELVKILVSNGAHYEARDTNERTALYLASGRGHYDVVKYLISVGANVNGEEIHGYTPLCEAVWQRYANVVELLLKSGARITHSHKLLHNAIQGQEEIVRMLVNHGGGINLRNDTGYTPLLLAVRLSQIQIVKVLLQHGANVNACNIITGENALHIAIESIKCPKDFDELLMCFLDYKIDLNSTALTGDTALNRALLIQWDHVAVSLIRHGADVNFCDLQSCGLDNLSIVSRRPSNKLAHLLIKAGHYLPSPDNRTSQHKKGTTAHWLHQVICKEPLNLLDLCRLKIRMLCHSKPLYSYVSQLPLPKCLKSFLMFQHEFNIECEGSKLLNS